MHSSAVGPAAGGTTVARDTTLAGVVRELNARALRAARWGGPLSAIGCIVGFLVTGHVAFLGFAAVALSLSLSSSSRLRAGRHDAEFLLAASGVGVVLMWPVAPDIVRGGLSGGLIVLGMLGSLLLTGPRRVRITALFALLISAQLAWPLFGMAEFAETVAHVAVSGGALAAGIYGMTVVRGMLERSEHTRIEVFRRVPVGLFRISRSWALIEVNPAFAEMLDYPIEDLMGKPVAELYGDTAPLLQLANRLGVASPQRYAHRINRRDGTAIWVRGSVQTVRDESGALLYYEGTVEDVTQRRDVENRARVNAQRFRNVFERAPIAIWEEDWSGVVPVLEELRARGVTDIRRYLRDNPDEFMRMYSRLRYLDVNPAGMDLVGASTKEEAFANTKPDPPPSPIADGFIEEFGAVWDGLDHMTLEVSGHTVDRTPVILHLSWAAARDAEGALDLSHVIVTMVDITHLRRVESHLADLIESKDELVASVSHELRTPITTIMGMAFEMHDNADRFSPEESKELVGLIADQSRELSNIVEDLLVAARSDLETLAVRPERLHVRSEVEQILASSAPGLGATFDIPDDAVAWADSLRFRQIMRNLLSNAHRYGGPNVHVSAETSGQEVVVLVTDDGEGVPDGDEEAIFMPYTRSASDSGLPGSIGLGLPVSRRLARLMDGDLTYRHDGGCVFELTLPCRDRRMLAV
jgi:PAS domain S-box-containing protein